MKMKIVQINSTPYFSTGKIALAISNILNSSEENFSMLFYAYGKAKAPNTYKFTNSFELLINKAFSHLFGKYGFYGRIASKRILAKINKIKPDIVHIHNIHSHEVDFYTLISGLQKMNIKVVYTFHDCWSFTGYCPYFDYQNCSKWQTFCNKCPQKNKFSIIFDRSRNNFERKKAALLPLDFTIVSPSVWLNDLVSQSFLKDKKRLVFHNGINLDIFRPTPFNEILQKNNLVSKKYVLGVAAIWERRKGLHDLLELSNRLPKDVLLVVVGHKLEKIDSLLYPNVVFIDGTNNQIELASIYTNCICLVNPTMEDNLPTVNIECLACGKPVVSYDTGGCSETIDASCGILVERGRFDKLLESVLSIVNATKVFDVSECLSFAKQFDQNLCFNKYIVLYKKLVGEK